MSKFLRFLCLVALIAGAAVAMFGLKPTLDTVHDCTMTAVQYCRDLPLHPWLREKVLPLFGLITAPISQDEHAVKLPDLHQFARQAQVEEKPDPVSPADGHDLAPVVKTTSTDTPVTPTPTVTKPQPESEPDVHDDTIITHNSDPASNPELVSASAPVSADKPAARRPRTLPAYYYVIEDEDMLRQYFNCTPSGAGWIVSTKAEVPENYFFLFSTVFAVDVDGENYDRSMPITKNTKGLIRVYYAD